MLGDFPLGIDSRSNDFRMHMNGGVVMISECI